MTTRILRLTSGKYMAVQMTVIGSSPAWPNPGGAHSGYLFESYGRTLLVDCGPGVLPRLREREAWPHVDAIAITHFHLDHWGDLVPWVWGSFYLRSNGEGPGHPDLWVHPGGREHLEILGRRLGFPDMFERAFVMHEYENERTFAAAGFDVTAVRLPHYTLETYGFRVSAEGQTVAYSGDSAPSERLTALARDADLFVCEATLFNGAADGQPRGHLSAEEAIHAYEASNARRLLLTHRPSELETPEGIELAYDGLVLTLP
ncbi:MAG: MBL fold metallo-hydrolase [Actinobacteria bacterium]|nr:MAG: MBL fold metallo-hydrolase [Actinomycetota bacterium]